MKNKNLKWIAMAIILILLLGLVIAYGSKTKETETTAKTPKISEKITEETIKDTYTGIEDVYVLKDAKDIDYLEWVLYDKDVVKDIKVDSSKVDTSKEGEYKLTYKVTVDCKALTKYTKNTYKNSKNKTVSITKKATVVDSAKAQELANSNNTVYSGKGETVKKSDGSTVKTEQEAPASTTTTGGSVVNSSNKEKVNPRTTAKPSNNNNSRNSSNSGSNNGGNSNKPGKPGSGSNSTGNTNKPGKPNSGPNNSNSGNSSNTEKPAHKHNWVNITKTVNHPAVTHQEDVYENRQVKVKDAWDEKVYVKTVITCRQCGFTTSSPDEMENHMLENGHSCSSRDIYKTVHHDAVYETQRVKVGTRTVTDKAAWTETVVIGQKCSSCGATKKE